MKRYQHGLTSVTVRISAVERLRVKVVRELIGSRAWLRVNIGVRNGYCRFKGVRLSGLIYDSTLRKQT